MRPVCREGAGKCQQNSGWSDRPKRLKSDQLARRGAKRMPTTASGSISPRPRSTSKGSRNKRTLLKEAEQHVGSKYTDQVLDSIYVIEQAMQHFFLRAKNTGRKQADVDDDYRQAAALAALVAPYRHPRLSAAKLAGGPNDRGSPWDDATAEELKAEIEHRLTVLQEAGILELKPLPAPDVQ
jgi:hypothetical protein